MRLITSSILLPLLSLLPASFGQSACCAPNPPCLGSSEAANIGLRWLSIFFTDSSGAGTGAPLVIPTIAENFTYYDEGLTLGKSGAVYNNRTQLLSVVSGQGYNGALVTDVRYSVLHTFASCDTVGVRWQSNQLAANGTNVTVPVGTPIEYKGTDYLQVDLSSRLIYNVTSSGDNLNYFIDLGIVSKNVPPP